MVTTKSETLLRTLVDSFASSIQNNYTNIPSSIPRALLLASTGPDWLLYWVARAKTDKRVLIQYDYTLYALCGNSMNADRRWMHQNQHGDRMHPLALAAYRLVRGEPASVVMQAVSYPDDVRSAGDRLPVLPSSIESYGGKAISVDPNFPVKPTELPWCTDATGDGFRSSYTTAHSVGLLHHVESRTNYEIRPIKMASFRSLERRLKLKEMHVVVHAVPADTRLSDKLLPAELMRRDVPLRVTVKALSSLCDKLGQNNVLRVYEGAYPIPGEAILKVSKKGLPETLYSMNWNALQGAVESHRDELGAHLLRFVTAINPHILENCLRDHKNRPTHKSPESTFVALPPYDLMRSMEMVSNAEVEVQSMTSDILGRCGGDPHTAALVWYVADCIKETNLSRGLTEELHGMGHGGAVTAAKTHLPRIHELIKELTD